MKAAAHTMHLKTALTSHVSATSGRRIGLTPEVGGCARLNHRLTSVVTAFSLLGSTCSILSVNESLQILALLLRELLNCW